MKFLSNFYYRQCPVLRTDFEIKKGESVETKFDNDRPSPSEDPSELENFNSLTEKELISTFGDALMGGKEAIIRNIARCREIYIRYSKTFMDKKFRLIHFDKIFLDYEISHMVPVTKLYPDDNCNPLRLIFKFQLVQLPDWSANQIYNLNIFFKFYTLSTICVLLGKCS